MKVLFIHTYYAEKGGEDVVFETEKAKLQFDGYEVEALIFNNSSRAFLNVVCQHFNPVSYLRAIKKIKSFQPNIVHIHNLHFAASPSVIWAAISCKIPVVMTLHNYRLICPSAILYHNGELFLDSLKGGFPWKAVAKRVYKNSLPLSFWLASSIWLHKKLGTWKKVDRFILLSPFAKNLYLKSGVGISEEQIIVKSNFIDNPEIKASIKKTGFVYVGRLSEEKGIDLIIQAFKLFPFNLIIAGDGPMRKEVEAFANAHHQVAYLGFLDRVDVQKILKSAAVLLFPSKSYEGMPMAIIEAFANATPVIASCLGSLPAMIMDGHDGFLFSPGSANDLISKIKYWLAVQEGEKTVFYQKAFETYQKKYSSAVNDQEIAAIYKQVLD